MIRNGAKYLIEDLGSRNGTLVNGAKIEGVRAVVRGDEITVGPAVAVVGAVSRIEGGTAIAEPKAFEARLAAEVDRVARY